VTKKTDKSTGVAEGEVKKKLRNETLLSRKEVINTLPACSCVKRFVTTEDVKMKMETGRRKQHSKGNPKQQQLHARPRRNYRKTFRLGEYETELARADGLANC
jgi:hypothetical protein